MCTGSLISKYLPIEAQIALLTDLVDKDRFDQVIDIFNSKFVDVSDNDVLCQFIFDKLISKLSCTVSRMSLSNDVVYQYAEVFEDSELKTLAELACKVSGIWTLYEGWISVQLSSYIRENKGRLFHDNFYENVFAKLAGDALDSAKNVANVYDDIGFIILLKVLEFSYLFEDEMGHFTCNKLDGIIMGLLACDDEAIGSACSNLTKWSILRISKRCQDSPLFDQLSWICIKKLLTQNRDHPWQQKICFTFLLRFLLQSKLSPELINFMQTNDYWTHIKSVLAHEEQESRKLGISILKLSIQKLEFNVDDFQTHLFSWSATNSCKIIQAWEKFTTLYEIVSLETALNQIEAASGHILELFNDPILPPSWGLILFSTGLKAPMESIRKYMMLLMFQVQNTAVFSSDTSALRNSFLPCAMEAHYFACDDQVCPYGDRLVQFIASIISTSGDQISSVLDAILEVLVKYGTSYDPARIYLSFGVLKSLKKKHSRALSSSHLQYIKKLFEFESEEMIFETTIQTIYLKLLLHVNRTVSPIEWIQTIVAHLKCNRNDYGYFAPLMDSFKDYAVTYFDLSAARDEIRMHIGHDTTFDVVSSIIFGSIEAPISQPLLLELARSGEFDNVFSQKAADVLSELLTGCTSNGYDNTSLLLELSCFNSITWKSVKLLRLFDSLFTDFSEEKLCFFRAAFKKTIDYDLDFDNVKIGQILDLYSTIRRHFEESNADFKVKDKTYAAYFGFVLDYLKFHAVEDAEFSNLIHILERNVNNDNGNFEGNLRVSNICSYLLENYVTLNKYGAEQRLYSIFEIISAIWQIIKSDRLVLKQRQLHVSIVCCLFNPKLLYLSFMEKSQHAKIVSQRLSEYGQDILIQAESRRNILPSLSASICTFIKLYGQNLDKSTSNFDWIIYLMGSIFAMQQSKVNIFMIKPIIAQLYDNEISFTSMKKNGLYLDIYGIDEFSARISVIDALLNASVYFREEFVTCSIKYPNFLTANRKTDGDEERERILKWQLVMLCLPAVNAKKLRSISEELIFNSFLIEFSPSVRIYMEWFIALALAENYEEDSAVLLEDQIFSIMDDHSKPILVVGAERICFIVLQALMKKINFDRLLERFTCALVTNATSNKPLVRHFSNSLTLSFWPLFESFVTGGMLRHILEILHKNADSQKTERNYRAGDANIWSLHEDITLTGVFGGVLKKILDHESPYISKKQFMKYLTAPTSVPIGEDEYNLWLGKRATKANENIIDNSMTSSQFQTKSGAWESMFDIDEKETLKNVKRSDLIVVSSLVDKAPNLGGICRLCDVLGVGLLTVQDLRVKNHPQFKNVAVTADRWMPMQEVPVDGIAQFMREKKKEGYTLIGLEQTDQSIKLDNNYKFPQKALILLGIEALGIPGYLLSELDVCVEIKQFGVIRSMNIQTATAVIVHSYTVQHM